MLVALAGCASSAASATDAGATSDTAPADGATAADASSEAGLTCARRDGTAPPCPAWNARQCTATCPAGLLAGEACTWNTAMYGNQFCVCTSTGLRCSNSQPQCPTSRAGACPFDGAQCDFCELGAFVTYICGRGTWTKVDLPCP